MTLAPVRGVAALAGATLEELRARLRAASYDEKVLKISERIGAGLFDPMRLPLVAWGLERREEDAAFLARLFLYDQPVERDRLAGLLGGTLVEDLARAELLEAGAGGAGAIRSRFRLTPLGGLWILSDPMSAATSCVMGPGPTTQQLVASLPKSIAGSVLDIGCGAGTLALLAARRGAREAVGTDINERAIDLSRVNARLNDLEARVRFLMGDLAAPVRGSRFDLVVSQPPYVVKPPETEAVAYLHGGPEGSELAMRVIASIPDLLEPNGRAHLLFDHPRRATEASPLYRNIRAALGDAAIDVVVLSAPGADADLQSVAYALLEDGSFGPTYGQAVRRYRAHLEALGVESFQHALVILRGGAAGSVGSVGTAGSARTPLGGRFSIQLPVRALPPGEAIEGFLAALDLASSEDEILGSAAVRIPAESRWIEDRPRPDPGLAAKFSFRPPAGSFAKEHEISEAAYVLSRVLDESPTIAEAASRYAELCGASEGDADDPSAEVREQVLDFVREGLSRGTLEPRTRREPFGQPKGEPGLTSEKAPG